MSFSHTICLKCIYIWYEKKEILTFSAETVRQLLMQDVLYPRIAQVLHRSYNARPVIELAMYPKLIKFGGFASHNYHMIMKHAVVGDSAHFLTT